MLDRHKCLRQLLLRHFGFQIYATFVGRTDARLRQRKCEPTTHRGPRWRGRHTALSSCVLRRSPRWLASFVKSHVGRLLATESANAQVDWACPFFSAFSRWIRA